MSIEDVIKMKQEYHVHNEKKILQSISHPFLIFLTCSTMDTRFLYLLFPRGVLLGGIGGTSGE
jgi:protein kinase X